MQILCIYGGGLIRSLKTSEMLDQIYEIQRTTGERVSNIILMGIGEPLDNYDNVVKFIRMISDENGLNISQRNITLSTCGLVDRLKKLVDEKLTITIAISLHAPNDELRREMMPIANRYSIHEIIDACRYYVDMTGRRITFEYSMVEGKNDSRECAMQLVELVRGLNCHINLIPLNPVEGRMGQRSKGADIQNFKLLLEKNHTNVTIRREMGRDIDAACGQLRNKERGWKTTMKAYAKTDIGSKRAMNQDSVYCNENSVGGFQNLFIVADGMGGHKAGDYASKLCVEKMAESIKNSESITPVTTLEEAVKVANNAVLAEAKANVEYDGMGTTMVACTVMDNTLYIANIGDSRLYIISDDIKQITNDHSWVDEMVKKGELTESQARIHPQKNIITRALGIDETVHADYFEVDVKPDDKILMCSDGLTNMVEDDDIEYIVRHSSSIEKAVDSLVEKANENGGKDNITVILVEI